MLHSLAKCFHPSVYLMLDYQAVIKSDTATSLLNVSIFEYNLTDEEIHMQSWNDFVENINPEYAELIQYLKERQLYINEPVSVEEEI